MLVKSNKTFFGIPIISFLLIVFNLLLNKTISANTYTVVNTTDDPSSGSLRWAITQSNAHIGLDNITFNIASTIPEPQTITINSALPAITDPVFIDGTTQPANGYTGVSPKIIVFGNSLNVNGFDFEAGSANSTIQGLFIRDFHGTTYYWTSDANSIIINDHDITIKDNVISNNYFGITVYAGGTNFKIQGNKIGTDASGTAALGNEVYGIYTYGANNGLIGGAGINEGNLISGNNNGPLGTPIQLWGSTNINIKGNKIGTNLAGTSPLPNTYQLSIQGSSSYIYVGGSQSNEGNLIACNNGGIYISSSSFCFIKGNKIGTDITGTLPLGSSNQPYGIAMALADNCVVGGSATNEGNIFANTSIGMQLYRSNNCIVKGNKFGTGALGTEILGSNYDLILAEGDHHAVGGIQPGEANLFANSIINSVIVYSSTNNLISRNKMHSSASGYKAIALNYNTTDQGNNGKQAPQIINRTYGNGTASVSGTSQAGDIVEVFKSNSLAPNPYQYIGSATANTNGEWTLDNLTLTESDVISATATDAGNNTSEFSYTTSSMQFTVTNTLDDGSAGSLRWAITQANAHIGLDNITFNIASTIPEPQTITINSALPAITDPVFIDGTTQPTNGYTGVSPKIIVFGNSLNIHGFDFEAGSAYSIIQGLFIRDFNGTESYSGIYINEKNITVKNNVLSNNGRGILTNKANTLIQGNKIGTDPTGETALGNYEGIAIRGLTAHDILVGGSGQGEGNLISGNTVYSIHTDGAVNVSIKGNKIGTNVSGQAQLSNGYYMRIYGSDLVFIGGGNSGEGNQFLSIGGDVFSWSSSRCFIKGNTFGVDATGTTAIGESTSHPFAILIYSSNNCEVGGSGVNEGNVIANINQGLQIQSSNHCLIQGNKFGTDKMETMNLHNGYDIITYYNNNIKIGGTNAGEGNTMANATFNPVYLYQTESTRVSGNRIYNFSKDYKAIELFKGETYQGNHGKQAPVISSKTSGNGTAIISGTAQAGDIVEVYRSNTLAPNPYEYLGSVTANSSGTWSLSNLTLSANDVISATSTDEGDNTSEFTYFSPATDFVVTNTLDDGSVGSLRWAINQSNTHIGTDNILFNIAGNVPLTIALSSSLPVISDRVFIDGGSQPVNGYSGLSPKVIVNGNGLDIIGFNFGKGSANSKIQGLFIRDFISPSYWSAASAIYINDSNITVKNNIISNNYPSGIGVYASGYIIQGNKIGTGETGTEQLPNGMYGIRIVSVAKPGLIGGAGYGEGNLISGGNYMGIYTRLTKHCQIKGNKFGTDTSGTLANGNPYSIIMEYSDSCLIGGKLPGEGNLISAGTGGYGIELIYVKYIEVKGNKIGVNINGNQSLVNHAGMILQYADSCIVGGSEASERNIIASNPWEGIYLYDASHTQIKGNIIGTDTTQTMSFPGAYGIIVNMGHDNTIGGSGEYERNVIANSTIDAINVYNSTSNQITQNKIYNYGGKAINFSLSSPNPGNGGKAAPVINSKIAGVGTGVVSGTSQAGDVIEVFKSNSTYPNGYEYLGSAITFQSNDWQLNNLTLLDNDVVVVTATDALNNTSEYSCFGYVNAGSDVATNIGTGVQLSASNLWSNSATSYLWTTSTGLDNDAIYNPTATPSFTSSYTVTAIYTGFATQCKSVDQVDVNLVKDLQINASEIDVTINGQPFQYVAYGKGVSGTYSIASIATLHPYLPFPENTNDVQLSFFTVTGNELFRVNIPIDEYGNVGVPDLIQGNVLHTLDATLFSFTDGVLKLNHGILSLVSLTSPTSVISYGTPVKKLDGSYYETKDGIVYFKYEEEYKEGGLTYKVYDKNRSIVLKDSQLPLNKVYGENRFALNLKEPGLELNSSEYYVLEIKNQKNETCYLRVHLN